MVCLGSQVWSDVSNNIESLAWPLIHLFSFASLNIPLVQVWFPRPVSTKPLAGGEIIVSLMIVPILWQQFHPPRQLQEIFQVEVAFVKQKLLDGFTTKSTLTTLSLNVSERNLPKLQVHACS